MGHAVGLTECIRRQFRLCLYLLSLSVYLVAMTTVVANCCYGYYVGVVRVNYCTATSTNSQNSCQEGVGSDVRLFQPLQARAAFASCISVYAGVVLVS